MEFALDLYAGRRSDKSEAFESVLVESLGNGTYRLVRSPGLVLGLAAGDAFALEPAGRFMIVKRGGNLCVQLFASGRIDEIEAFSTSQLTPLNGRLDGKAASELVYTVPVRSGFAEVERALNSVVAQFSGVSWYYGNVYDPEDGVTPLKWWEASD